MRKYICLILLLFSLSCMAEGADSIRSIVVDDETGMRLRNATVRLESGDVRSTRWDGSVTLPKDYKKVIISQMDKTEMDEYKRYRKDYDYFKKERFLQNAKRAEKKNKKNK